MPIAALAGAIVIVAVIAVLEIRTLVTARQGSNETPEIAAAEVPSAAVPASPSLPPVPAGMSQPAAAARVSQPAVAPQPQLGVAAASAPIAAPSAAEAGNPAAAPAKVAPPKSLARKRALPADAPGTSSSTAAAPAVAAEAPRVAVAPARVVDMSRNDPGQNFNAALARCAREAVVTRMGCEQRVRVQYCGDSWGQVPQCAIGTVTDHGQ